MVLETRPVPLGRDTFHPSYSSSLLDDMILYATEKKTTVSNTATVMVPEARKCLTLCRAQYLVRWIWRPVNENGEVMVVKVESHKRPRMTLIFGDSLNTALALIRNSAQLSTVANVPNHATIWVVVLQLVWGITRVCLLRIENHLREANTLTCIYEVA